MVHPDADQPLPGLRTGRRHQQTEQSSAAAAAASPAACQDAPPPRCPPCCPFRSLSAVARRSARSGRPVAFMAAMTLESLDPPGSSVPDKLEAPCSMLEIVLWGRASRPGC